MTVIRFFLSSSRTIIVSLMSKCVHRTIVIQQLKMIRCRQNSVSSAMVIPTIVLPAAMTPRAVALTMCVLYLTSIKYISIAWPAVTTIDGAWRCCGSRRLFPLALLASQEC
jgi:hypothetical protein